MTVAPKWAPRVGLWDGIGLILELRNFGDEITRAEKFCGLSDFSSPSIEPPTHLHPSNGCFPDLVNEEQTRIYLTNTLRSSILLALLYLSW